MLLGFGHKEISHIKPSVEFIKRNARILFIDDQKDDLIEILQDEGWNVEYWDDVRSLRSIEEGNYDLIILDIGGVGKKYCPEEEGLGILKGPE